MGRVPLTRIAIVVTGIACLACGASMPYTATTNFTRTQSAVTFAPAGPHATGAVLADNQTAIELGATVSTGETATSTRANGALGNVTTTLVGRTRVSYGLLDRVEFGADLELATGSAARIAATDIPTTSTIGRWIARGGLQVRAIVAGSRRIGLGVNVEGSFGSMAYTGLTHAVTTTTMGGGPTTSDDARANDALTAWGRAGLFIHGMPTSRLALLGGLLAQTTPRIDGQQTYSETCNYRTGDILPSSCSYTPTTWPSPYVLTAVGTLWASASYSFDHVSVIVQIAGNVLADPAMLAASPFAGDMALRYVF